MTSTPADSTTACPCSSETTEKLQASPEPDRIITLVHGTFAQHAPWMREGPLWEKLRAPESLPGSTLLNRFCWSGANSHSGRLTAGDDLAKRLRELAERFPKARKYVIGHSHGGNVILYATKDEAVAKEMTGMITLATPFITVRRRRLPTLVTLGLIAITLAAAFEAWLHSYGNLLSTEANPIDPTEASLMVATLILVWLGGTMLSAFMYRPSGSTFGLDQLFTLLRKGKGADAIINAELARMRLTPDDPQTMKERFRKILVARPIGDEASMSLIVSQFFSWFENRILTLLSSKVKQFFSSIGWLSWIWKILLLLVVFILAAKIAFPATLPWLTTGMDEWTRILFGKHYILRGLFVVLVVGVAALILLFGFLALLVLIGLLLAGLAFGLDTMFWNHFVSTTAECSPPGSARVFLQSLPPSESGQPAAGLAHSGIYSDPAVIDEIVEWIRSREEGTTS